MPPINRPSAYAAELYELVKQGRKEGIFIPTPSTNSLLHCRLSPLPPIADIREPFTWTTSEDTDFAELSPPFNPVEKLTIDEDSVSLIKSICQLKIDEDAEFERLLEEECAPFRKNRTERIEEPLVRGEFEVGTFDKPLSGVGSIAPLKVEDDGDGRLGWSDSVRKDSRIFEKKVQAEMLDLSPEVFAFLKMNCGPVDEEEGDIEEFLDEGFSCHSHHEPISPPLLPYSAVRTPELPPICPLPSLKPLEIGSIENLLDELMEPFMLEDAILNTPITSPSNYLPKYISTSSPFGPLPFAEDQRLEVPLSPPARRVRFGSILASDNHRLLLPPPLEKLKDEPTAEALLEALAKESTLQLEREMAQEQLQEEDSTMRIPVPILDFSVPNPPWDTKESMEGLRDLKSWAGAAGKKWGGVRSLEMSLKWVPFTKEEAEVPNEQIDDDGNLESFLLTEKDTDRAEEILMSGLCTPSLTCEEDEEEIMCAEFDKIQIGLPQQVQGEVASPRDSVRQPEETYFEDLIKNRKRKRAIGTTKPHQKSKKKEKKAAMGESFSAANYLDTFMISRSKKLPAALEDIRQAHTAEATKTLVPPAPFASGIPAPRAAAPPFPAPIIGTQLPPANFIISTTLVSEKRTLLKHIKTFYPAAKFVERDFTIPIGNDSIFFTAVERDRNASAVPDADIIISPKTGLIITTTQKLRQTALPGERTDFISGAEVKHRVMDLCKRYERLLVVIHTSSIGSKSDMDILTGFLGFTKSLSGECGVVIRFISGGEEDVARWIVGTMNDHDHKLIDEETVWEGFLRKAGLNAFAAQVVLKELSVRDLGGLRGFLQMGGEEKVLRFEAMVGRRVLARVREALEGWTLC